MKKIIRIFSRLFIGLSFIASAFALEEDKNQPINIQADRAKLSEAAGTAVYTGSVELNQGTLTIQCDQLTLFNANGGVSKVEAQGSPAFYTQLLDKDKPPVEAVAKNIVYLPQEEKIILTHEAKVSQGLNEFQGELIEYNLKKQLLTATGQSKNRVRMILQPTE